MSTPNNNPVAVEVNDLSCAYGRLKVLDRMSLRIPGGISFGLLGPNGAGKTTLIRIMVGLLRRQAGTVKLLGKEPSGKTSHLIGYMPQLQSLYSELSVFQNVDFFARIYLPNLSTERQRRVEDALKLVNLWERRDDAVFRLSGGMKQRTSLACAIVHEPPLLFLDEPTVGLDPELRANFWAHFTDLTKKGVTIIISSHTMDDAAHCNQLAFIRDGHIVAQGTPDELKTATGQAQATLEDAFLYYIRREQKFNV
jgi:ABC-2 type transport system ATP-binding protein